MATSFHRNARCPHIGLKEGGDDLLLTGGLLPFPRTGCVLYANPILSHCSEIGAAHEILGRPAQARSNHCDLTRESSGAGGRCPTPAWRRRPATRRDDAFNFDIYTMRPDGSDVKRLTTSPANDAHAVWTADGRILFNSGIYGWKEEAALYDRTFQPYGQTFIMNADGTGVRQLTDSLWEDAMPVYVPANAKRISANRP